ncbi:GSCOCG00008673001-RA-CDS, partial [Cotesia congregata]
MSDLKSSSDLDDFVLHVSNIPEELDADGLERVFRQYGIVTSLVAPDNKFAFVSYKTYAEAESAIANLNQQKPMFMRVKFSSRSANSKMIPEGLLTPVTPTSKPPGAPATPIGERDYRFNESGLPYHGRTPLTLPPAPMSATRYEMNARHYPINPELYKYFDELEYPESSSLWTRGQLTLDTLGQRKVSGGRGYVYYAIPDPSPAAVSRANKVLEMRSPGRFAVGSDQLGHLVDKCIACHRDAVHCCANCASSYCSRDCQFRDWPRHKNECSNVPPLLEKVKVANGVHDNDSTVASPKLKSPISKPIINPDLANVTADAPKKSPVISTPELPASKPSPVPEKLPPSHQKAPEDPRDALKRSKSHPEEHRRQDYSRQSSAPEKKLDLNARLEKSRLPNLNLDHDFAFQKPFLSSGGFTEVQIVDVHAPSIFSVQKTSDLPKLTELMKDLNENITKCPKVSEIIPEKFYGALFDGIWHRVQLILGPKPKLDYVDYGTIVDATPDLELRDIGALSEVPRFACLIRVPTELPSSPEYSSLGPERKMLVKMVTQDSEGIINVQVFEKEPKEPKSLPQPRKAPSVESVSKMRPPKIASKEPAGPPPAPELPSMITRLPKGALATVEVTQVIDGTSAVCVVLTEDLLDAYDKLLMPLKEDCDKTAPGYADFTPKVNEVVCGLKEDGFWVRGRVLAVTPKLKVASLDEGIICEVVKTIPMVSKYADIPIFACLIQTSDVFPLEIHSTAYIMIINQANGSLEGEFVETKLKFQLKPWILSIESFNVQNGAGEHQNGRLAPNGRLGEIGGKFEIGAKNEIGGKIQNELKEIEQIIKNNSSVAIQAFRDASIVFVRSLETKEVERYLNVVQEAARLAQAAPKVSKVSIGDKVLAQFKLDDNYYRSIVVDVKGQEIKVAYLDFGNQEVTEIERLKEMPKALKQQEDGCVKVVLKGIEKLPLTPEASAFLGTIADQDTPFVLSYDSKIQDGVILTAKDGVRVNDKINKFLKPKFEEQQEIFKLTDIEMGKLGSVGAKTNALYLGVLEPGYKYIFAPMDRELIAHLSTVMPAQLMEYAEKTEYYIPRFNELCVALFEGEWCRGCCFNPTAKEGTAEIYFMDYGNIAPVKHKDLRKMPEEFMKPCALGCICNVV